MINISTVYYFKLFEIKPLHLSQSIKIQNISSHLQEKDVLPGKIFLEKKYVVFGGSFLKMSVLFDKNFQKSIILQYCLLETLKVPILFYVSLLLRKRKWCYSEVRQNAVLTLVVPMTLLFFFSVPQKDETLLRHHKEV